MLITCSFSWYQLYERSTYEFQPNRDKGSWTDARRYVNMCKSVCFYIRLLRRIVHRNSMGRCRLQEVSYEDTSLFICLQYEYTCTLTRRDSSNIGSGLRVPNKPESTYQKTCLRHNKSSFFYIVMNAVRVLSGTSEQAEQQVRLHQVQHRRTLQETFYW